MLKEELLDIANEIIKTKSEKQNIEVKLLMVVALKDCMILYLVF